MDNPNIKEGINPRFLSFTTNQAYHLEVRQQEVSFHCICGVRGRLAKW